MACIRKLEGRMLASRSSLVVPPGIPMPQTSHIHPTSQSLYGFNRKTSKWTKNRKHEPTTVVSDPATFAVLTWNVDFMAPFATIRFQNLLSHLERLLSTPLLNSTTPGQPQPPTIILLQEVPISCFPVLLSNPFVRGMYHITDKSPSTWLTGFSYGTISLVPESFSKYVSSVFRTKFPDSRMGRDALYIDLDFPKPSDDSSSSAETLKTKIRVANTHLESLGGHGDSARAVQLASISQFLSCDGVQGGLVGGDMNPISPSDVHLSEEVGLSDAWMNRPGPGEEQITNLESTTDSEGHTWGYQPRRRYPPRRMDKILFVGGLRVDSMERVGVGLKVTSGLEGAEEADVWVSDHYGLLARFTVD